MGHVIYQGNKVKVPDSVNGRDLKKTLGINEDRVLYTTDLDGKNRIVSNGDTIAVSETRVDDLPHTERG